MRLDLRGSRRLAVAVATLAVLAAIVGGAVVLGPRTPGPSAVPSTFDGTASAVAGGPSGSTGAESSAGGPSGSPSAGPTPASASPSPVASSTAAPRPSCPPETERFPPGYSGYHTYTSMCRLLVATAAAHPDITRLFSIGRSAQGREIWAMEISTHLADGTHPPGVLFDGLHHGLEHLALEMPLAIMGWLVDGYGRDPTVTQLVRTRAVFIVFDVNPDGAAYDIAGGRFHGWRKNRQSGPGGAIGTDLNRNYADHWGCCGLVSANPSSPYYRGPVPFSAPETRAVRDFVQSLVFDGRQEIRAAITFHSSGRLVMWPYGYTRTAVPSDMRARDEAVFVAMGRAMARLNGYTPEQASALYVDSGTARDWYYGTQGIFAFTFELGTGTYQPTSAIAPELARNRRAVLYLISAAGCPVHAIDAGAAC